ncbi:hypothetical protein BH23ACT10_BH23ACT10_40570 [soil metagenome]
MARSRKQFPLRISPDLYAAYEAWAGDEFRSVNAQIEAVLMDAARRAGRLKRRPVDPPDADRSAPPDAR